MKNFLVFDKTTGEIKRTGMCQDELVKEQAFIPGEESVEAAIEQPERYRVDVSAQEFTLIEVEGS